MNDHGRKVAMVHQGMHKLPLCLVRTKMSEMQCLHCQAVLYTCFGLIIGASLSEPHINVKYSERVYIFNIFNIQYYSSAPCASTLGHAVPCSTIQG